MDAIDALDELVEIGWQVGIERQYDGQIALTSVGRFDVVAPTLREAVAALQRERGK